MFSPNPNAFGYVEKNTRKYEKSYDVWSLQLQIEDKMQYGVKKKSLRRGKEMMYVKTQILKKQRRKRAEE